MLFVALFIAYITRCSLVAIIAPANQDGQDLNAPSTWICHMNVSVIPVETPVTVSNSSTATIAIVYQDTPVIVVLCWKETVLHVLVFIMSWINVKFVFFQYSY